MTRISLITLMVIPLLAASAQAAPLTYRGKNPNITPGADPFNATAISERANLTRPNERRASTALSDDELLKRGVLASVSSQITQRLTSSSSTSGTVNFGDGSTATYDTIAGTRYITITNTITGQITEISFPL